MNAQIASSRLLFSMGRDGVLPRVLGKVHPKYQTPWVAAIFLGAFSLVLTLTAGQFGGMTVLAPMVNFGALASFIVLNFGVFWYFWCKEKQRGAKAVLRYLICPWIGILILIYVFTGFDALTYGVGISWFIVGTSLRVHFQGLQRSARRLQEPGSVAAVPAGLTVPKGIHRSSSFARRSARHLSSPRPCRGLFLYTRFAPRNSHLFPMR